MKIFVNNAEFEIFSGAKVIDAVRMYSKTSAQRLAAGRYETRDVYGNIVAPSGSLSNNSKIYVKLKK